MEISNSNIESITTVVDEGLHLEQVFLFTDDVESEFLDAVVMKFGNTFIKITAMQDDSIKVVEVNVLDFCSVPSDKVKSKCSTVWNRCIGLPIRWFWLMENNKGYTDAFQIEFAKNVSEKPISIQLRAEASELTTYIVEDL